MLAALIVLAPAPVAPAIDVNYEEFAGLKITVNGIPIVQGSSFQYYEDKWTRGIYSSNWRPKEVFKFDNGLIRVRYIGDNGYVVGTLDFQKTPTGVEATYEYRWRGSKAVRLESCLGLIWYPCVEEGLLGYNGASGLPLSPHNPPADRPLIDRPLGPDTNSMRFDAPFGRMTVRVLEGPPATLFDARNYTPDWAKGKEVLWFGHMAQWIKPDETLRYKVEWVIEPTPHPSSAPKTVEPTLEALPDALGPSGGTLPIIPKPKEEQLGAGRSEVADFEYEANDVLRPIADQFESSLWRRWRRPATGPTVMVRARVESSALPPQGYQLSSTPDGVTITAPSEAGVRNGFQTLLWLVRAENGRLVTPHGSVKDWPSLGYRGTHMFVGPTALAFQSRLMDQLLGPLKLNNVVLQCERTNWLSTPNIETKITMERADLKKLFDRYRERGIEPTPLIQSLGHVGWLFENEQNLDIALNPYVPFTLDPRKEKSQQLLTSLWKEAVDLLKPKTVHFGLDEIDNRGLPDDPGFTTTLWRSHTPFLMNLAKELQVQPMMWGDIMLGPGEAIDAVHAKSVAEAKTRRSVVPKGTWIADWHYKEDSNPANFKSLDLWKAEGQRPLAATWDKPGNIYGFTHAAIKAGTPGVLQTTWAGYESSELGMIRAFPQFAAYILSAEYAWSGRIEKPQNLPYDPVDVLRRVYFSPAEPARSIAGKSAKLEGDAKPLKIGGTNFRLWAKPFVLNSPLYKDAESGPNEIIIPLGGTKASELAMAVDCLAWTPEGETLARAEVILANGEKVGLDIAYGQHARSRRDSRTTLISSRSGTLSAIRFALPAGAEMKEMRIARQSLSGALRVHGLTVVDP